LILRSVIKHVRDQNWFAVFIDFLIVVVGVFIGIQVANWNEQRQLNAEMAAALENLGQEVALTAAYREARLDYHERTLRGLGLLHDWLDGAEPSEAEKALIFGALERGTPPPNPSRYASLYELQNTGQLRDIASKDLRKVLGELLAGDRQYQAYEEAWLRQLTAPPFSPSIVHARLTPPEDDQTSRDLAVSAVDIELARRTPEFRERLVQLYDHWATVLNNSKLLLRVDRGILELLEAEGFQPSDQWADEFRSRLVEPEEEKPSAPSEEPS